MRKTASTALGSHLNLLFDRMRPLRLETAVTPASPDRSAPQTESTVAAPSAEGLHLDHLDSVRGLAALSVLFEHYVIAFDLPIRDPFWRAIWDYSPLHILWDGAAAVSLFFVLSGLVLSLKHFRHGGQPDLTGFDLGRYWLARCFRLGPPYFVALLVSSIGYSLTTGAAPTIPIDRHSPWLDDLWHHRVEIGGMLLEANLLAMPKLIVMVPQSWTLAIELLYSFLIPIGVLLTARSSLWLLAFVYVAVKLLGASPVLLHFALGILIARHYSSVSRWLGARRWLRRGLLAIGIVCYTAGDSFHSWLSGDWPSILAAVGSALFLIYLAGSHSARRALNSPALRFLGRVSFSFYLLHMLVLFCFMPMIWTALGTTPRADPAVWWLGLPISTALSLLIAAIGHRFVELPSIALGKTFNDWIGARRAALPRLYPVRSR